MLGDLGGCDAFCGDAFGVEESSDLGASRLGGSDLFPASLHFYSRAILLTAYFLAHQPCLYGAR